MFLWGTTLLFTLSVILILVPRIEKYDNVKEIGRKNGFVFYLREAE